MHIFQKNPPMQGFINHADVRSGCVFVPLIIPSECLRTGVCIVSLAARKQRVQAPHTRTCYDLICRIRVSCQHKQTRSQATITRPFRLVIYWVRERRNWVCVCRKDLGKTHKLYNVYSYQSGFKMRDHERPMVSFRFGRHPHSTEINSGLQSYLLRWKINRYRCGVSCRWPAP